MKYFLLLSLVCLCAFVVSAKPTSSPEPLKSVDEEFEDFKKNFDKTYATPEEEAKRKKIFTESYNRVKEQNEKYLKGLASHFSGINQFSDLAQEEFVKCCTGFNPDPNPTSLKSKN